MFQSMFWCTMWYEHMIFNGSNSIHLQNFTNPMKNEEKTPADTVISLMCDVDDAKFWVSRPSIVFVRKIVLTVNYQMKNEMPTKSFSVELNVRQIAW